MKRSQLKPARRSGLTVSERREAELFKAAVGFDPCAACGTSSGWLHAHHVVYQQHLPAGLRWDPRNALALCHDCHHNHHGARPVDVACLTDQNIEFAKEVLGEAWEGYLARRYSGGPPLTAA